MIMCIDANRILVGRSEAFFTDAASDIVVSTDGTNVYAVSSTSSQIFWWDRNPVTGALINEQSISNSDCIFATSVSSSLIISFDQANIYTVSGNIL